MASVEPGRWLINPLCRSACGGYPLKSGLIMLILSFVEFDSQATWRAPCLGAPGQLIAGGAGARLDHPVSWRCSSGPKIVECGSITKIVDKLSRSQDLELG